MLAITHYVVQKGNKHLHLTPTEGVFWGKKDGAFCFYSAEAAAQVACALTADKAKITVVECEEV